MSDDEEVHYAKKQKTVHYGSLEESERNRLSNIINDDSNDENKDHFLSNIHISNEYMELENDISKDRQALLEEFERRKKARHINVSTDDSEVKKNLRHLGEPICLFGEGPADRRNRLRELLANLGEEAIKKKEEEDKSNTEKDPETTWYHEGPDSLRIARLWNAGNKKLLLEIFNIYAYIYNYKYYYNFVLIYSILY